MSADHDPVRWIADTLAGTRPMWPTYPVPRLLQQAEPSRTEQIRELVRISGPLSAKAIALQLELERTDLVSALLKVDLQKERVRRIGPLYEWNHGYDEAQARELAAAVRLLRRHGYTVRRRS